MRGAWPQPPAFASGGRNGWLDLLRCLAIALVLARHGHRHWLGGSTESIGPLDHVMLNGWMGVDLFFCLSGYLIGMKLLADRARGSGGGYRHYLAGRALRILPAYLVALFAVVIGSFPLFQVPPDRLGWRVGYHLLMLQDYLPADLNVVLWSLGVEAKFYVLAPVLLALLLAGAHRFGFAATAIASLGLAMALRAASFLAAGEPSAYQDFWPAVRSPFHTALDPLLLGMLAAVLHHRAPIPIALARTLLPVGLLVLVFWAATEDFMRTTGWFDATLQPALIALGFAAMVAAAGALPTRPLFGPLFSLGARLSYCLYLVHFPLLPLAAALSGGAVTRFWAAFLGLSCLLAALLHYLVERPFLRIRPGTMSPHRRWRNAA